MVHCYEIREAVQWKRRCSASEGVSYQLSNFEAVFVVLPDNHQGAVYANSRNLGRHTG